MTRLITVFESASRGLIVEHANNVEPLAVLVVAVVTVALGFVLAREQQLEDDEVIKSRHAGLHVQPVREVCFYTVLHCRSGTLSFFGVFVPMFVMTKLTRGFVPEHDLVRLSHVVPLST